MSCSMAAQRGGLDGPCQQDGPSRRSGGPVHGGYRRGMQSRYLDGLTIRPLRNGDTATVSALFERLGARSASVVSAVPSRSSPTSSSSTSRASTATTTFSSATSTATQSPSESRDSFATATRPRSRSQSPTATRAVAWDRRLRAPSPPTHAQRESPGSSRRVRRQPGHRRPPEAAGLARRELARPRARPRHRSRDVTRTSYYRSRGRPCSLGR